MKYWLNLFTWNTWQEFLNAGATTSGFRERRWATVRRMRPGDLLLCYMTGLSRFFAILEVTGKPFKDNQVIWSEALFPARIPVRIVLNLAPEHAVPVKMLSDGLSYFQDMKSPHSWTGHFRGSPTEEKTADARIIIAALEEAVDNPVARDFDHRKLERKVPAYETEEGVVTIPDNEDEIESESNVIISSTSANVTHEEIQSLLLILGSEMGLDVWVARNDRGKSHGNHVFAETPGIRDSLPRQFDEATNRTIEFIDVLWLQRNAIVAAFEIEHTTAVYSGLLRMADLIAMQPNLKIRLYLVAPDERRDKVITKVNRPTFTRALRPPLTEICQFIPYSALRQEFEQARDLLQYLSPEFLEKISEPLEAAP